METQQFQAVAGQACRLAGQEIIAGFGRQVQVSYKQAKDPVTEVDLRCQQIIFDLLMDRFPEHGFVGEESAPNGSGRDFVWVVDPLDGTKNFAHGYPHVAVSIGLIFQGTPIVGVIYDPVRQELFEAAKGKGATLNGKPIAVSERGNLNEALLVTGFGLGIDLEHKIFTDLEILSQGVRRDGSAALDFCNVAAGRLDAYFQLNLAPWDVAAGLLLVQEAGGMVTDYRGRDYRFSLEKRRGQQLVATNVRLHRQILDVLAPHLPGLERHCH